MGGVNIYNLKNKYDKVKYAKSGSKFGDCVFISYNHKDEKVAEEIANHIMDDYGYNVYFALYDKELDLNDAEKLVERIQEGIKYSTHLIGIITENSKQSWWVPYEIGYAQAHKIVTCSIRDNSIEEIPEYLKINDGLDFENITDLDEFFIKANKERAYWNLFSKPMNLDMANNKYSYFDK